MKYGIIYKITNLINKKIYIGQTTKNNPYQRINKHFKKSNHKDIVFDAIHKYGKENFHIEIICSCLDKDSLNNSEIILIKQHNSLIPNGYNIKIGGNQGGKCSPELKKYIGKQIKTWYNNNPHPNKGKKFKKEHIENLTLIRIGFDSINRKKARESYLYKNKIKIKAIHIETNNIYLFDSITECAKKLNLIETCISRVLKGSQNRKQHKGYKFEKI